MSHPYCQSSLPLINLIGIKSCWSEPIISSSGEVLGTFACFFKQARTAEPNNLKFIQNIARLTAIAIEKKQREEELRIAATAFQSHEAILVTQSDGSILQVNSAFTNITGYSEEEVIGKNPNILASGKHSAEFYQQMYKTLNSKGKWQGEIWNRRKNGEIYPEWLVITAVRSESEELTQYVGIFSDISDKKQAEKIIRNLAYYDPLTNLANRRLLLDRLEQEVSVSKRRQTFGALIFLDIDKFKILNDSLGHAVGDELLIQVARRIKEHIREEDTACRFGGDEFVILIANGAVSLKQAANQARNVAEKIRVAINKPYHLIDSEQSFSPSIGISVFPEMADDANVIIQQADTAMYLSKEQGRNAINFFRPSMQEVANQRLDLEKELRKAVNLNQFQLLYQPQMDATGQIVSVEALIRWLHPDKGIIMPKEFIAVAEEINLILPIGEWVLNTACQQMRYWAQQGVFIKHIAVNVSAKQFHQPDFVQQVKQAIKLSHLSAECLMLELTEGVLIENIDSTVKKMLLLTEMGVAIAIDDFGTGYSSLAYLKRMPIKQLKIDRSFVKDIISDPSDALLVETIIKMGQNLGQNVLAEGVETEQQFDLLKQHECQLFQGYLFSRPVSSDEIEKLFYLLQHSENKG